MRPDPRLPLLLVAMLLAAACSKSPSIKAPKIKGTEQVAQVYRLEDSAAT